MRASGGRGPPHCPHPRWTPLPLNLLAARPPPPGCPVAERRAGREPRTSLEGGLLPGIFLGGA